MYNPDLSRLHDAIAYDVFKAILADKTMQKHIIDYEWLSGSSTYVYPIDMYLYEVKCQVDTKNKKYLEKAMERIVKGNPDLFCDAWFWKSDGSCPSTVSFKYSDTLLERIKNKK